MRPLRRALIFLISLAVLATPSSSHASPEWVQTLTLPTDAASPAAAMAPDGTLTLAWTQMVGSTRGVIAVTRPPGGAFSGGLSLTDIPVVGFFPSVATGRNGSIVVAWVQQDAGESARVAVAFRTATGDWSPAQTLSLNGADASNPQVAVADSGEVAVAWVRNRRIQAVRRTSSGMWTQPEDISPLAANASSPRLAVDGSGNAFAVWLQRNAVQDWDVIGAARRPAGGTWSAEPSLSTAVDGYASWPSIRVGMTGLVAAVWNRPMLRQVFATVRSGLGAWEEPEAIGPSSAYEDPPAIAVDDQGFAVALVTDGGSRMRSVTRTLGADWAPEPELTYPSASDTYAPRLASSFGGGAIGAWRSETRTSGPTGPIITSHVLATVRRGGGNWGEPQQVASGDVSSPEVTADDQGNGAVVWVQDGRIKVRGYDAAGPDLHELRLPTRATAGLPAEFSVAPRDRWSPVFATSWDFGDGQGGSSATPSHTYGSPGRYLVRMRSEDTLGNVSTAERMLDVAPPPAADKDGDGQPPPDDCDDLDPRRRRGFVERPGNAVDEDCDGAAFDVDGDRSYDDDCDDEDARRRPGAEDVPRNRIDEDCYRGDAPFPPLPSAINIQYGGRPRGREVLSLLISRVPKRSTIRIRCSGRGCPKRRVTVKVARSKKKLELRRHLARRTLRTGTTVEVRVVKAEMLGRVRRDRLGAKRVKIKRLCLEPRRVGQPVGFLDPSLKPRPERAGEQCY
jgi:PKD domain/Putative metal-binding motif